MFRIVFDNAARDGARLSELDRQVLTDCASKAEIPFLVITRTASTPFEQAQAMYTNCRVKGPQSQLNLYGPFGDMVIRVYIDSIAKGISSEAAIVNAMECMIRSIGAERVSHHCVADWSKLHVLDVSATRIEKTKREAFEAAIAGDGRVVRHFSPYTVGHDDPAFHLEIPQA